MNLAQKTYEKTKNYSKLKAWIEYQDIRRFIRTAANCHHYKTYHIIQYECNIERLKEEGFELMECTFVSENYYRIQWDFRENDKNEVST